MSENRLPYLRCVIPAHRPVDVETKGASLQLDAEARAKSLEKKEMEWRMWTSLAAK
ncbi:MAG: hypothetical protein OXO48_07945 [Caldilineaceae bacterium]|nr:hypothetical protein [Caldilineaceae bacterium]